MPPAAKRIYKHFKGELELIPTVQTLRDMTEEQFKNLLREKREGNVCEDKVKIRFHSNGRQMISFFNV